MTFVPFGPVVSQDDVHIVALRKPDWKTPRASPL